MPFLSMDKQCVIICVVLLYYWYTKQIIVTQILWSHSVHSYGEAFYKFLIKELDFTTLFLCSVYFLFNGVTSD